MASDLEAAFNPKAFANKVGKGDGGKSTAGAIHLAKQKSMGNLTEEQLSKLPENFGMVNNKPIFNEGGRTAAQQQFYETWNPRGVQERMAAENRVTTETPWGTSGWRQEEDGTWTQYSELSPELQELYGMAQELASGEQDTAFQDAAMASARRNLGPMFEQRRKEFEAQMFGRGLAPGSEIYDRELAKLRAAEAKAYEDVAFQAMQYGDQKRMSDYNMIASLISGMPSSPFVQTDVLGSYQPYMSGSTIAGANRAQREAARAARRGQNIGAGLGLLDASGFGSGDAMETFGNFLVG